MKRAVLITTMLSCGTLANLAIAQGHSNFSGTWVPDAAKSASAQQRIGPQGREVHSLGRPTPAPPQMTLVIEQDANELRVTRKMARRSQESRYSLDGREDSNPSMGNQGPLKSHTHWDGDKLVTEGALWTPDDGLDAEFRSIEERWLSDGGTVLNINTISITMIPSTGREGRRVIQCQVFNKQ